MAVAAGISCGAGIHGDEGWYFVSSTIDRYGGEITLREGTLVVTQNCVVGPTPITLRRHDRIKHAGAIGPVFEVEVPSPDTFVNDAQVRIATTAKVANDESSTIGSIVEATNGPQWVPDSQPYVPDCPAGSVCGPVRAGSFSSPAGDAEPTATVKFAIVKRCSSLQECPRNQACNSGACQQCPSRLGGDCNL